MFGELHFRTIKTKIPYNCTQNNTSKSEIIYPTILNSWYYTNVNRSGIWDPTTKQFPFEDCLYVRFLIEYSMLHCHFEISHLHLSWWWSVLASLKDTDLQ